MPVTSSEPSPGLQPDPFTHSPPLSSQAPTIRVPHNTGIPQGPPNVTTRTQPEKISNAWRRNVAEQNGLGKRFGRVRVVDEPLTEGQAFLLARAPSNVAAGDEVRYLPRGEVDRIRLPELDFWLIDSRTLLTPVFDDADTTLGVTVAEKPAEVLAACHVRDAAWHFASNTADFARRIRSDM
ncbi:DUF6879 family protein [Streptomyces sp. NPDC093509]|uniref:DUF6879 family protein n=1 Tax=Streptomyces sp. NPDC093509 TaxID=3154982 RepID=UPI00344CFF91